MGRWCAKTSGGQASQASGRSRGGFSTKIHLAVDALGHPRRFLLTAGHGHDSPHAAALSAGCAAQVRIADKGDASEALLESVTAEGVQAVIPPRSNRIQQREYDRHLSQERHFIECCINKLKPYRRVCSRFEKLVKNSLGFLRFVSTLMWVR